MRAALLLLVAAPAAAQPAPPTSAPQTTAPRPDQPGVMAPLLNAPRREGGDFGQAYRGRGSPPLLLLWNRRFSDAVQSDYALRASSRSSGETVTLDKPGARYTAESRGADNTLAATRLEEAQPAPVLSASDDARVESAFMARLRAAGVRFVDRAVAMRIAPGARDVAAGANVQALELAAIRARSRYLIEVRQLPAEQAPLGAAFRIEAKDLDTAAVLASFTTPGTPPQPRAPLVPGPTGFERAPPPPRPGPEQVGAQLAEELMQQLGSGW